MLPAMMLAISLPMVIGKHQGGGSNADYTEPPPDVKQLLSLKQSSEMLDALIKLF